MKKYKRIYSATCSSKIRLFFNGAMTEWDWDAWGGTSTIANSPLILRLGASQYSDVGISSGDPFLDGYMDEMRLTIGSPVYTSDFTPPGPFSPGVGVDLLLHCDGLHGSTSFPDSSGSSHVTVSHNNFVDTTQKEYGTASMNCFGVAPAPSVHGVDVLSPGIQIGTNDFCVEMWCNFNSFGGGWLDIWQMIFEIGTSALSGPSDTILLQTAYGTHWDFWNNSMRQLTPIVGLGGGTWTNGVWHHIAFSLQRGSPTMARLFFDGVMTEWDWDTWGGSAQVATLPLVLRLASNNYYESPLIVPGSLNLDGDMDEVRVTVGNPVYTTDFTPPTGPFSPGAGVVTLLHCDGTQGSFSFPDSSGSAQVTLSHGPTVETSAKKFGTGSMKCY